MASLYGVPFWDAAGSASRLVRTTGGMRFRGRQPSAAGRLTADAESLALGRQRRLPLDAESRHRAQRLACIRWTWMRRLRRRLPAPWATAAATGLSYAGQIRPMAPPASHGQHMAASGELAALLPAAVRRAWRSERPYVPEAAAAPPLARRTTNSGLHTGAHGQRHQRCCPDELAANCGAE